MTLAFESYIFDPRPRLPFHLSAKRYQPSSSSEDGLTLVFTHGTGFHKEQWEPTIEHLFELQAKNGAKHKIREAWSIDAPNHGDSAVLNEEKLLAGCYDEKCEFCRVVSVSYSDPLVQFRGRTMLGVLTLSWLVWGNSRHKDAKLV